MTDFGETVTISAAFAQAPGLVVAMVTKPDGTLVSPTVNSTAAPVYTITVSANMVGTWGYRFEGTGLYEGVEEGEFYVEGSAVLTGVPKYTYDLSTKIGELRLLIDDRDLSSVANATPMEARSAIFTDAELQKFLDSSVESVYMAASKALTVIAGNRSLMVQSRRIGGTTVDYGDITGRLLKQAESFREQAYADAPGSAFAEIAYTDFAARQIIHNSIVRNE